MNVYRRILGVLGVVLFIEIFLLKKPDPDAVITMSPPIIFLTAILGFAWLVFSIINKLLMMTNKTTRSNWVGATALSLWLVFYWTLLVSKSSAAPNISDNLLFLASPNSLRFNLFFFGLPFIDFLDSIAILIEEQTGK